MTEEIKLKRADPVEPLPFECIRDAAGEIVGAKTCEIMTRAEFKRRHPELANPVD